MNFTFGIVTGGKEDARVNAIIDSIEAQHIPEYEVLVSGPSKVSRARTRVLDFDVTRRPHPWITAQKNQVTKYAQYENVVYMHDYIVLCEGWYDGQLIAGDVFAVRMDKILNANGERFRDWTLDPFEAKICAHACLLPYEVTDQSQFMYISGSYWIAKRTVMKKYPQHEGLYWGCAEDLEWSSRVRKQYIFNMNTNSSVRLLKQKAPVFGYARESHIEGIRIVKHWMETSTLRAVMCSDEEAKQIIDMWLAKTYDGKQSKQWAGPVPVPMEWKDATHPD